MNDDFSMEDFDFKPITSGLGFHHQKAQEIKPVFTDKTLPTTVSTPMSTPITQSHKEQSVYQNDLSIFYGASQSPDLAVPQERIEVAPEKTWPLASKGRRVVAYVLDLCAVACVLGIVITIMARTISMDLLEVWTAFPHEITPLVLVLFCGFYVIYFSIFEKSPSSTLGKNIMGLKVVTRDDSMQSFGVLVLRSIVTLANFLSLGLFAWFDLQNKVTNTKVIWIK